MAYEIITLRGNAKDLTGETFSKLTAIAPVGRTPMGNITWLCICKCGTETVAASGNIRRGRVQSCGCHRVETSRKNLTTHGLSQHPLFNTWYLMKNRCYNKNDKYFYCYGGKGISVCPSWLNSFPAFVADMGERPSPEHTL
ncbi:unnamed protein product, partial [marine sediment metagenome]